VTDTLASPVYAALSPQERDLIDKLYEDHAEEIERAALLGLLLEPGYEKAFLFRYFGPTGSGRLSNELEEFHIRLIRTALYEPRGLVLYPAAHGKTTLIGCLLPILEMIRNPDIRIIGVFKNETEALGVISTVKAELSENELLIADYGPFVPEPDDPRRPWKADWISVRKRQRIAKEPTYAVFGSGAKNVLGHRSDWVICDDVVTEKNSSTPDQREHMLTWYKEAVETSPEKIRAGDIAGRITTVGTMFHPKDLYDSIRRKTDRLGNPRYVMQREDAIADETTQTPLWPERYSWEDLMDMRTDMGTLSFNRRMRNRPVDESMQPFREDYIMGSEKYPGCLDTHRVIGEYEDDWRLFQSLDPAVGSSKNAKFVGHVVFGIPPESPEQRVLIEINRLQLTVPQQKDLIIDTALNRYPSMVLSVVETNGYQKGLEQVINDELAEMGITLRIEPHLTTGQNKLDPEIGLMSLAPLLENGRLRFPMGNPESRRKSGLLIEEFLEWPFFAYTDLMMASWFGILKSNVAVPNYKSFNRLNPRSMYRENNAKRGRRMIQNPWFAKRPTERRAVEHQVGTVTMDGDLNAG